MEETSSFFTTPDSPAPGSGVSMEMIHSSESGYCDIFRIDRMGRFRALKCLKPEFRGQILYESLLRKEFEIGYSLSHPNICEYYSLDFIEGLGNCIEMEWVDGRTLEKVIAEEKPEPSLCDKILDEICDALAYTHSKQVLHRDLKPTNILVTYTGNNVKIIDFGFSDSDTHSILKVPAGTVNYTAPEVLGGAQADVRSDIYSLGLIIWRLSRRHRSVARKCCETSPSRRYSTIAEVRRALHSRSPLISGVVFILVVAAMALFPYLDRVRGSRSEEDISADMTELDSTAVSSTESSAEAPVNPAKGDVKVEKRTGSGASEKNAEPASDQPVDPEAIDELFRQATDLFN